MSRQFCCVGKHGTASYFDRVPAVLADKYRVNTRDGLKLCCIQCWPAMILAAAAEVDQHSGRASRSTTVVQICGGKRGDSNHAAGHTPKLPRLSNTSDTGLSLADCSSSPSQAPPLGPEPAFRPVPPPLKPEGCRPGRPSAIAVSPEALCDLCEQCVIWREVCPNDPTHALANMMRLKYLHLPPKKDIFGLCQGCWGNLATVRQCFIDITTRAGKQGPQLSSLFSVGKVSTSAQTGRDKQHSLGPSSIPDPCLEGSMCPMLENDANSVSQVQASAPVASKVLPPQTRLELAQLQTDCNASTECAAKSFKLLRGEEYAATTAQRCLIELSEACYSEMAIALSSSRDIALGSDASNTWFDRNALEVHVSYAQETELLGLVDQPLKAAGDILTTIIKLWAVLNTTQHTLGLPVTNLYYVRCLYSDNASVNTGRWTGLRVLFDEVRFKAWEILFGNSDSTSDATYEPFTPLVFKGCDDHIAALVLKNFSTAVVDWARAGPSEFAYMAHKKKVGGYVALPFYVLKRLSKRLLGFLRPAWAAAKAMYDRAHPLPTNRDHRARILACSFGRFCTFGVTAGGVLHYRPIIGGSQAEIGCETALLKPDTDKELREWLQDSLMLFMWQLLASFSVNFELPFLKQSHALGNVSSIEYKKWFRGLQDKLDVWKLDPCSFVLVGPAPALDPVRVTLCRMLVDTLSMVLRKHVLIEVVEDIPVTIRGTNRWGETVFRYMRELLDRNPHYRMFLIGAYVRGKRSAYRPIVDADPKRLCVMRKRAREILEDKESTYISYAHERLIQLRAANTLKEEKLAKKATQLELLDKIKVAGLLPAKERTLTKATLIQAAKNWRDANPWLSDRLVVSGNKKVLMDQLTDDILDA
jgi:hypothetical protein